ncbi:hypothetical protein F2P56_008076 [Juglans regia]|uniref:Solute carrier family 40 member n=1 Tax=Juglans regia TaxID=51240 RepID=A0A834D3W8_JUGRE|nr:hypothetical protein F2P56_008076 [Juglans regia]
MNIFRGRKKESAEIEEVLMVREPLLGQQDQQPSSQDDSLPSLLTYLYVGHFLARWGARMWEFSVGLYMISIWPDSLLFAAIYGVVESASTALFGPIVGQWVDRLTYVKVLRLWLVVQNLSFIIAGATVIALVEFSTLKSSNFTAFISLVVLTNISGAVAVLSTLAGTILIEREWVVVISEGRPPEILTKINSIIRRIDLISKLFAPNYSEFYGVPVIFTQWTFLLVCVASIWVHKSLLSAYLLMAGVATSRLGLWTFDLAVIQQMQDHVPESDRCVVGGVQNSLQSTLDLMSYVMGIIISNPKDFWKLILLSFLVSTLAALLYTLYVYLVRKHLFHFEKLFLLIKWLMGSPEDSHSI